MTYNKIKGKLVEKDLTYQDAALFIGVSEKTFTSKINGKVDWKREEMAMVCKMLDIPIEQMHLFFYNDSSL